MSLGLSETETQRAARQSPGPESAPRKNPPPELQATAESGKSYSIARRIIVAALAAQIVLAAGIVTVAFLYGGPQAAMYGGAAAIVALIMANVFVARTVRRSLEPLSDLAGRAAEISAGNLRFKSSLGSELPMELLPLAESVEAALGRAETAFRQQRDFTSDAAHELKTSVAIVKSALQVLLQRPRTQREYEIGLENALEDCARLENLLERMLRLARIEQSAGNGARPKRIPVDLASTCEAAISRIDAMAEARGVVLTLEAPSTVSLPADPEDLELIWMNLLENAVQNSPPGSTVTIGLHGVAAGRTLVCVQDSGPGIAPADLPHIFERFRRGDSSPARTAAGFGLGLAICKAVVETYGGTIEAANLPDGGAEFRVNLPVNQV